MKLSKTLSRDEMKNVKAGRVASGCTWNGCSTASSTYNCWAAECLDRYGPSTDGMACVEETNQLHKNAIGMCGTAYG